MKPFRDTKTFCAALDQFGLPGAVAHLGTDSFVAWNQAFLNKTGFSTDAIRTAGINKRLTLAQPLQREIGAPEAVPETVDIATCLLSCPSKDGFVAGHAAKNLDGYMLLMLYVPDPVANVFVQGQSVGRTQERERIRRLLHDALSPQLLVALFAVAGAEARAEEEGHAEAKELARAMKALEEGIENIVKALEKPG